jgi:5-methylcytosine-specific restriction endonuclease McrA
MDHQWRQRPKKKETICVRRRGFLRPIIKGANGWKEPSHCSPPGRRWEPPEPTIRDLWAPVLSRAPWQRFSNSLEFMRAFKACFACGAFSVMAQRSHIVPRWAGGSDEAMNLHVLCPSCHVASEDLMGLGYWHWFRNTVFVADLEGVEAYRQYLQREFERP